MLAGSHALNSFYLPILLSLTAHFFQNRLHRRISFEQCVAQFVAKLFTRLLVPLPRGCQRRITHCRVMRRAQSRLLIPRQPSKAFTSEVNRSLSLGKPDRL